VNQRADLIAYPFPDPPGEGEVVQVADGVVWLRLPLPMKLDHVNCYALDDGDGWTIIDTGMASARCRKIWEGLFAGPLAGKPVKRLIVTHHHPDHVGLAAWFIAQGVELLMPRTAWLMARMLTLDVQPVSTPESLTFYTRAGMDPTQLAKRASERPFNFADCVDPLPLGFTRLQEGQVIVMGGREWVIRMGDGHAPEHATFWSADGELVIGGDQLLPSISPNLGVYPTEPDADPVGDWIAACDRLAAFATPAQLVLPGHKLPFTGLPLRLRQKAENHHSALARLVSALATPLRAADCFAPLYKREIGSGEHGLALVEAVGHLNHLHRLGQVRRWLGDDGAYLWQAV
jgi:glyoxylase-like metal-dependent hydrolase (beta-lactamase superfamily II)